jgi:biopolymer transport protein TolR
MTTSVSSAPSSDMNVTPLIDVLLTLLVIFMIIVPMTPRGERATIPQPPPPHEKRQPDNRTIVVQVLDKGGQPELKINQQDVSQQDLQSRLIDIYKTRAQKVMFIKADDALPWSDVVNVIDTAHAAGVDRVGLITAKIEQSS